MTIKVNADAFFRAVTATGFKLIAYHFNLDTGEIVSRTMRPDEVVVSPEMSGVKPLPKLGDDLSPKKNAPPFESRPVVEIKKKLFDDTDLSKKPAFNTDFWKRNDKEKLKLFGEGFKRASGSRKLAEIFSEPSTTTTAPQASRPTLAHVSPPSAPRIVADDLRHPRIPVASETDQIEWIRAFAKDFGDPEIRDEIYASLKSAKPLLSFNKVLRKHQRMSQQWERCFRKTALAYGAAWLSKLDVQWELIESDE
ncbi:MAG: hypothetical protein V1899_06800 [Planctomycetota bacterium]